MTALTYDKLRLRSRIKIGSITDLYISIVKNEHGVMEVEGIIDGDEDKESIVEDIVLSSIGTEISLHVEGRDIPLFSGIVENVELEIRNSIYYARIKSASATILMDRVRKKRSFQSVGSTYEDIVDSIVREYKNGATICTVGSEESIGKPLIQYNETDWEFLKRLASHFDSVDSIVREYKNGATICTVGSEESIGKPLIQYNETDWEFLKRLASHFDSVIVPEITQMMPRVWFGFPNTINMVEIDEYEYIYGQDTGYYEIGGMFSSYSPEDFRYIEVKGYNVFDLGDFTVFNGQGYVLYEIKGKMNKGELIFTYRFGADGNKKSKKFYNDRISGMSLLGEVSKTDKERIGIKLDIDNGSGGEYLYDWVPETGNMMYCMPQVGTKVSLYFKNSDEREAVVVNCIRTNGDSCEKMKDPSKRAFATEHNKELKLYPNEIGISSDNGSFITIMDEKGIDFNSKKKIKIIGESIEFSAPNVKVATKLGEINILKGDPTRSIKSSVILCNEFNFLGDDGTSLIGREFQEYPPFEDEPTKASYLGSLLRNVLGGLAAVGAVCFTLATAGLGAAVIGGAAIGGAIMVGMMAVSDIANNKVSSIDSYVFSGLLGATTGAVAGKVFHVLKGKNKILKYLANALRDFAIGTMYDLTSQMSRNGINEIDLLDAIKASIKDMVLDGGLSVLSGVKGLGLIISAMLNIAEFNDFLRDPKVFLAENVLGLAMGKVNKLGDNDGKGLGLIISAMLNIAEFNDFLRDPKVFLAENVLGLAMGKVNKLGDNDGLNKPKDSKIANKNKDSTDSTNENIYYAKKMLQNIIKYNEDLKKYFSEYSDEKFDKYFSEYFGKDSVKYIHIEDRRKYLEDRFEQLEMIKNSLKDGKIFKLNRKQKGNHREALMDVLFECNGYIRIGSIERVKDVNDKGRQGIDAVYQNLNPPPPFVVVEVKADSSQQRNYYYENTGKMRIREEDMKEVEDAFIKPREKNKEEEKKKGKTEKKKGDKGEEKEKTIGVKQTSTPWVLQELPGRPVTRLEDYFKYNYTYNYTYDYEQFIEAMKKGILLDETDPAYIPRVLAELKLEHTAEGPDIRIEMFKLDKNGKKMKDEKTKKPKHYKF